MTKKLVYAFSGKKADGKANMKNLLGGKGANLAEMASLGIDVPPGFTVSTEACVNYFKNKNKFPPKLWGEILMHLKSLEKTVGKKFGGSENPLLVSVRSGARVSMPGMMDTVLNLGLNENSLHGLAKKTQNEWFALDTYRRFISMFSNVVLNIDSARFESILEKEKKKRSIKVDTELSVKDLSLIHI